MASAADSRFHVGAGANLLVNDPFLARSSVQISASFRPKEYFALELIGGYAPDLGEGDWKALTSQIIEENHVSPDISKYTHYGGITGRVIPFRTDTAEGHTNLGILWGFGLVKTTDDLEALQAVGDPSAMATQNQLHSMTLSGVMGESWKGHNGFQVSYLLMGHIETVNSTTLETKKNRMLGIGYVRKL